MSVKTGNVLIIADREKPGGRLGRWVAAAGERPVLVHGADTQIFERGDDETIDLVVTDLDDEAADGRRILENLRQGELFHGVPQIHLTRNTDREDRTGVAPPDVAALSLPEPTDPAGFQSQVRLAAEVGRLRREIFRLTTRDALTHMHDRRFLTDRLDQELARARRHDSPLAFVLFEIDQLDTIRTRYGPRTAEAVVLHVSRVLSSQVRREDVSGRWGSLSFGVVLPGTSCRGAATFANHVRGDVEERELPPIEKTVQVRVSAGIAAYRSDLERDSVATLIQAAEQALNEAKLRGGNRVSIEETLLRGESPSILIADADATLLDPVEDLLTLDGYDVMRAESAKALMVAARMRRPDLLILDLQLAGGDAKAARLVERVQALHPDDPVLIVGVAKPSAVRPSRAAGRPRVDRYLTKPFSVSVLRSIAHDLLGRNPAGHGGRGSGAGV